MPGYAFNESAPKVLCPYCETETYAEYVNVGTHMEQVTPHGCEDCHAVEIGPFDKIDRPLTEVELRTGWYEPEDMES